MSSPTRQMNTRRLPPLPGKGKRGAGSKGPSSNHTKSYHKVPDMIITGFSPIPSNHHGNNSSFFNHDGPLSIHDLNREALIQYLNHNPEFLDTYVLTHVNEQQIENWYLRKTSHLSHHTTDRQKTSEQFKLNGDSHHISDNFTHFSKYTSQIHTTKGRVAHVLSKEINHPSGRHIALSELASCVVKAVHAEGCNLYATDAATQEIVLIRGGKIVNENREKICDRVSIAAQVAYSKETTRLRDVTVDHRFPNGLGVACNRSFSVIVLPIMDEDGNVLGVLEVYRNSRFGQFSEGEEEVASFLLLWSGIMVDYAEVTGTILAWGGLLLQYAEIHSNMTKQRKLHEFLLTVTKSIFQDIVSMDTVIMKIMNYAQKLVNADRASLFLVDNQRHELYARIFDIGNGILSQAETQQREIRFPIDKGVAGHVASSGQILNIPDAYSDKRFNRDVDLQTGYHTKTILCMPIYIRGNIIGVVQMVNKLDGIFSRTDEEAFETFAVYCGLALHHAKLYEKIRRSEQKYRVAIEVLSYHNQCTDEELKQLRSLQHPEKLEAITSYEYSPWEISDVQKPIFVLDMFKELFTSMRFDISDLSRFTLTVRKNYRHVPYHNWVHAFSVAHSMYTVIKRSNHQFTSTECLALFVACLCHDLDHRGKTNAFMVKSASPLAAIYSTSTMEHHHFNQTVAILQHEGHNIFKHLTSEEYKQVLGDIKHCILATDLALFFPNRARLKEIADKNEFSWSIQEHRRLLHALVMTACDLCAMTKPWDVQLDSVNVIYQEFWAEGDEEKSQGFKPMPMMDRDKQNELPQLEVGFILGICLPCYELLAQVIPSTKPMLDGTIANLKQWQVMADKNKEEALEAAKQENNTEKA
ncbi:hypothetical protein SNE40_004492 [Patella caerulea]|uniref:Phosphodiesterase n=1 Tax=Patella caerulea TaxID=87958 RepID=A0AAN8K4U8_PATCE